MEYTPIGELFNFEKGQLQSSKSTPGKYPFITAAKEWKTHNEYDHNSEALIFAAAASGSLGRTHYVNEKFISSDLCYILTPKDKEKYPINLSFYHFVFNSLRPTLVAATKSGTSKESINQKNFRKYKLPYFDIKQQNLWIDILTNTLEKQKLLLSELTHQSDLLKKLRQQILQEAIEGKLTADWRAENPGVEPARELLEKIKAEKAQLIKEKKIRKQKPLPPISAEEKPFELPEGWEWVRLGQISPRVTVGYVGPMKDQYVKTGIPFLRSQNVRENRFRPNGLVYISQEFHERIRKSTLTFGDVVVVRSGNVGVTCVIPDSLSDANCSDLVIIKKSNFIISEYISFFMNSVAKTYVKAGTVGIALTHFNTKSVASLSIPLPPLAEQKAIVSKVEKLLQLCEELETQINENKLHAKKLIQSVLREAFAHPAR